MEDVYAFAIKSFVGTFLSMNHLSIAFIFEWAGLFAKKIPSEVSFTFFHAGIYSDGKMIQINAVILGLGIIFEYGEQRNISKMR